MDFDPRKNRLPSCRHENHKTRTRETADLFLGGYFAK